MGGEKSDQNIGDRDRGRECWQEKNVGRVAREEMRETGKNPVGQEPKQRVFEKPIRKLAIQVKIQVKLH